ncbi:MAG: hypothetical protein ABIK28_14780 [Planctomycetota bacterium]
MQPVHGDTRPCPDPPEPESHGTGEDLLSPAFFRDKNVAERTIRPGHTWFDIFFRLAKYVIPIMVALAIIDILLRTFLPPEKLLPYMQKEFAFYTEKIKQFQALPYPDVLFLGSSRMRDDLDPEVFAMGLSQHWRHQARAYNLGLAGAHMEEVYTLAASYLPDPPPPYVIIGFSGTEVAWPYHFTYASRFLWKFENFVDYLRRVPFEYFYVRHVEYYIEAQICRFWYLFAQRDALLNCITENLETRLGLDLLEVPEEMRDHARVMVRNEKQRKIDHVHADSGYHPVLRQFKDLAARIEKNPEEVQITNRREFNNDPDVLNDTSADMLRLIVPTLRRKGCKVAIVETPTSPYMQEMNPVLHGEGFRRWMKGVAEELDVPFFAFPPTPENGLDNTFYGDASHLSDKGAKLFARMVLKRLVEAGFFDKEAAR